MGYEFYDMLLPRDIPRYRGRMPVLLHLGVPAPDRETALRDTLALYGCADVYGEVLQAIDRGAGQLSKRPDGMKLKSIHKMVHVTEIKYEPSGVSQPVLF